MVHQSQDTTEQEAEAYMSDASPKTVERARMDPKVVFWVVFTACTVALVMFSLLFLHAAARNHWGPF